MLTIKDLSASKELDNKALTEVRGGSNFGFIGPQVVAQGGGGPKIAVKADTLTQIDSDLYLNVLSPGGLNWGF